MGVNPPTGSEIIIFNNNHTPSMNNNFPSSNSSRHKIIFTGGATTSRTIDGTTENTFYDYSGAQPKIENNTTSLHTINFPIKIGHSYIEINPAFGDLTISDAIDNNGNHIDVYSTNGSTLTISNTFEGSGGYC